MQTKIEVIDVNSIHTMDGQDINRNPGDQGESQKEYKLKDFEQMIQLMYQWKVKENEENKNHKWIQRLKNINKNIYDVKEKDMCGKRFKVKKIVAKE